MRLTTTIRAAIQRRRTRQQPGRYARIADIVNEPASATSDPDATAVLRWPAGMDDAHAGQDTLPTWAQEVPVEVPVVVPVADQAVVLTTVGYTSKHHHDTVQFVDPDWYNAPTRCAQYPRRVTS